MIELPLAVQRHFARASRETVTGIAIVALSIAFYGMVLRPSETQLTQLRAELAALTAKRDAKTKSLDQDTPAAQLDAYYRFFPNQGSTPMWLEKLYQAARTQNIKLEQGEYRATERAGALVRYQITLPVKGTYAQLRTFIAAVLQEVPMASLDHISFERQKIGNPLIEAKIKFTLYLSAQP